MKSIISIVTFLSVFFVVSVHGLDEEKCQKDLAEVKKQLLSMKATIDACEYRCEQAAKKLESTASENTKITDSMQNLNEEEEKKVKKSKPQSWKDEKDALLEKMSDMEEDLYQRTSKFEKLEKNLKKEIKILKRRIEYKEKEAKEAYESG